MYQVLVTTKCQFKGYISVITLSFHTRREADTAIERINSYVKFGYEQKAIPLF